MRLIPTLPSARHLHREGDVLRADGHAWTSLLARSAGLWFAPSARPQSLMAAAAAAILGERLSVGIVVTKYGHAEGARPLPPTLRVMEAGHPIPDESGLRGSESGD